MIKRVYNFSPGPATLPLPVLEQAQSEFLNYNGTGMSILEISHRSKDIEGIVNEAETQLLELLGAGTDYRALFLQGGASLQFSMIPLNLLKQGGVADYILTGGFAEKAWEEAQKSGTVRVAASTKEENYSRIPRQDEIKISEDSSYLHITTNNTIYGTQWHWLPATGGIPLVADMSSDILSRPLDFSKFDLVYAGAQKNLGPSGVTVVILKKKLLEMVPAELPNMLRYDIHAKSNSLYNTPTTFGIYMINLVLHWIKEQGGLTALQKRNTAKAGLVYDAIDNSNGFYQGFAEKESRSIMNITFRLSNEDLTARWCFGQRPAFNFRRNRQPGSGLPCHEARRKTGSASLSQLPLYQ